MIPPNEPMPTLSTEERLDRAKPKEPIQSSAVGGGIHGEQREFLMHDGYFWTLNPTFRKPPNSGKAGGKRA